MRNRYVFSAIFKSFIFLVVNLYFIVFYGCVKDKELKTSAPSYGTSTMKDINDTVYKTVKIGNQWWMAENLKVNKYRNGTFINSISNYDTAKWANATNGSYCIYDDNVQAPGYLYNYYAVSDPRNLAPEGWHIPTDADWKELEMTLGMSSTDADIIGWRGIDEGDKLKIEAPQNWVNYPKVWGTNESGFTALGGGCRMFNGTWSDPYGFGFSGFWWTANEYQENNAWYRSLDHKNSNIFRYYGPKTYGFSIRCVKDR